MGLRDLAAHLGRLAGVPSRVSTAVAKDIQALVDQEYETGTDAYGAGWESLAEETLRRGRHPPPLTDSGRMRDTTRVRPLPGAGIAVTFDVPYAKFHHTGTKHMPARPVLPTEGRFPPSWEKALRRELDAEGKRSLGGR
jgi:hypothetical protein